MAKKRRTGAGANGLGFGLSGHLLRPFAPSLRRLPCAVVRNECDERKPGKHDAALRLCLFLAWCGKAFFAGAQADPRSVGLRPEQAARRRGVLTEMVIACGSVFSRPYRLLDVMFYRILRKIPRHLGGG